MLKLQGFFVADVIKNIHGGSEELKKMVLREKRVRLIMLCLLFAVMFVVANIVIFPLNTAYASRTNNGTNTDTEWKGSQTTPNLITIGNGNLEEQGWNDITSDIKPNAVWYEDADLKTEEYGWGIQAQENKDIGNKDYGGGVWYKIELSDADRVKAAKGDLTVSASSINYHHSVSTNTRVSLRLFFYDSADEQIGDMAHDDRKITKSATVLNIEDYKVPVGTTWIKYYVSNYNSVLAKAFIGGMTCTLTDTTAPQAVASALLPNETIEQRGGAIAGDTVQYSITFDEKISVTDPGTAKISVAGTSVSHSSYSVSDPKGIGTVTYSFTLPDITQSGIISFDGVSGLSVADEGGNTSTVSFKGNPETLQYYKTMSVSAELENLSFSGENTAKFGTDYTATLNAIAGYSLPSSIEIYADNSKIDGGGYSYDASSGKITIYGSRIKGDIVIKADGTAKGVAVTFDKQGGSGGTDSVNATYDAAMPNITPPVRTGYTFAGYYTQENKQYYDASGTGIGQCDSAEPFTLYAHWTANSYTIQFDGNKPQNASKNVTGSMSSSSRIYDDGEIALPDNAFSLEGWTFKGWATTASGDVVYTDKQTVKNLTDQNDRIVTLYAVWQANSYTVSYQGNKPAGASANIVGATENSSHIFDTDGTLTSNGFTLKGWTFKGWATSANGDMIYTDGASVRNLTANDGDTITLYAVWEANKYEVNYIANQPSGASAAVSGSMTVTEHTYDTAEILGENKYTLKGWTFLGWSLDPYASEIQFADGGSISNLTDTAGGEVSLYAVWKANDYTVVYNGNKPAGASSVIVGEMANSPFTYDAKGKLMSNVFSLTGWTFKGWSLTPDGTVTYTDGGEVTNLTAEADGEVTLYAVWEEKSYTVSFDTEGGSRVDSANAKYDNELPTVTPPTRKGYNFAGYYTAPDGTGEQYYGSNGEAFESLIYKTDGNITLYAYWTPIHYDIELYSMGEYAGVIENVVFGELRLPSAAKLDLERKNYDFIGWNLYDEQNWSMYSADTDYIVGLADTDGETVVLYAAWLEKDRYTVSFDANGGVGAPALMQVHEGETITLNDTIPSREDYTFLGWALTSDAAEAQYSAGGEFTMGNSVVTLYAVWERNPSLSYDANGGVFDGTIEISYPAAGAEIIVTSMIPEREGYVFEGWSTSRNAESAEYQSGAKFTMPDTDTVLYAVWINAQYRVTSTVADGYTIAGLKGQYYFGDTASFSVTGTAPKVFINGQPAIMGDNGQYTFTVKGDTHIFIADGSELSLIYAANGGTGAPVDNNGYTAAGEATVSDIEPTRLGYTFIGWAMSASAENAEFQKGATITFTDTDIVLYAVWQANVYSVKYDANSGFGNMNSDTFTYGTLGTLSANAFEREGYTFIGWALSEDGETIYADKSAVSDLCAENNGEITLYAVWEHTVTVITFETESGTQVNSPISVAYGEYLTADGLIVPTRGGYIFAGYYTERNGKGTMIFDAALNIADDYLVKTWDINVSFLKLYPYWTPISYTVIYMNGQEESGKHTAVYGNQFDLLTADSLGIIAPEGWHFAGWTTAPSGQIALYLDGQSIIDGLTQTDGDEVLLYAVFEADERFSVSYNANGGSNAPVDDSEYLAGDEVIISQIIPEKEGYIFGGWSYDPNDAEIAFPYKDGQFTANSVIIPNGGITLYAVWVAGDTLQAQIDALKGNAAQLKNAIETLEKADEDFTSQIEKLGTALQDAIDAINALDETYATDAELTAAVERIEGLLTQAQSELEGKISQVQSSLDDAVSRLESAIDTNAGDITELQQALNALDTAYKNADAIINGKIDELKSEDIVLGESIDELESAYKKADTALQANIDAVDSRLKSEAARLEGLISANDGDIDALETALNNLDAAYKAADTLINSDIRLLKDKDAELAASIVSLETAYKTADTQLQQTIDALEDRLEESVADLTNSITDNKADIESKLSAVETAYKAADAFINSEITALKKKDTELSNSILALDNAYKIADAQLQQAIETLEGELEQAVADLTGSIAANKTDIESKLTAVEEAYKAADTLINGEISALKNKDTALVNSIAALETAYKAADTALQESIESVESKLESEIARLEGLISSGTSDINELEQAIADLNTAYKAADTLINNEISVLKEKDTALNISIAALEEAYKAADAALWAGIQQVEDHLDLLIDENDKTSMVYMIINIVLAAIAVVLIVTLIVKALKKKKTEN